MIGIRGHVASRHRDAWSAAGIVVLAACSWCGVSPVGAEVTPLSITGIGFLSSTTNKSSFVEGVSNDGNAAVGRSTLPGGQYRIVRWTRSGGIFNIGMFTANPGQALSIPAGISTDGAIVAGMAEGYPGFSGGFRAFRWTAASGLVDLGLLPDPVDGYVGCQGMSDDGSEIVGDASEVSGRRAYRWTSTAGMTSIGVAGTYENSLANGVNSSGDAVVGDCFNGWPGLEREAFLWTTNAGMVLLGRHPSYMRSSASDVNRNATVITGRCWNESAPSYPMRWTPSTGIKLLPIPPQFTTGIITSMSSDGSILAFSFADSRSADPTSVPYFWTARTGLVALQPYLTSKGLDLTAWSLSTVYISSNGRFIGGSGKRGGLAEGWIANMPVQCPADLTNDDVVDDADFSVFAAAYDLVVCGDAAMPEWCPSDINLDDAVNDDDFVMFCRGYDLHTCP